MPPRIASLSAVVALALSPALSACGGAPASSLLDPPPASAGPEDAAAAPPDATVGDDAGEQPGDDAAAGDDADASETGAPSTDAAADSGSPSRGVICTAGTQTTYCQGTDICCVTSGLAATCQSSSAVCLGTQVHCADGADCPSGQLCCGTEQTVGFSSTYQDIGCDNSCAGMNRYQFCDAPGGGADPAACPAGETCTASTVMSGYYVCK